MAIATILTASTVWSLNTSGLSNLLSWSTFGYLLISIGIAATFLSSYRYLLGYLVGGMGYWLVVEGLQSLIMSMDFVTLSSWHGYVAALSLTWFMLSAFFMYRYIKGSAHTESINSPVKINKRLISQDKYIEHTPIYDNYKPRFHN